jgi:hypothetical protein
MSPKASEEVGGCRPGFYFRLGVEFLEFRFVSELVNDLSSVIAEPVVNLKDVFFIEQ